MGAVNRSRSKKIDLILLHLQDIEFTVENKALYILETRSAKRTAQAAVRVAVSMVKERVITEREALIRLDAAQMDYFMHPVLDAEQGWVCHVPASLSLLTIPNPSHALVSPDDPAVQEKLLCRGAPASAGAAVGVLVFSVQEALLCQATNQPCILITREASVDDVEGFKVSCYLNVLLP